MQDGEDSGNIGLMTFDPAKFVETILRHQARRRAIYFDWQTGNYKTHQELATKWNLSRERIRQIINREQREAQNG